MASLKPRRELRNMLVPGAAVLLPGVANALAARVVADQGFAAAYVTGAGIANTFLGVPDIGLLTVSELAAHVAAIREAFAGPLVVDADTGFGNAMDGLRTVELTNARLKELGYAGVIYANVALQSALKGMQAALGELRRRGHMGEATKLVMDFSERQRLVHKDEFDALERQYVAKE